MGMLLQLTGTSRSTSRTEMLTFHGDQLALEALSLIEFPLSS
jgi:hypothetical protein